MSFVERAFTPPGAGSTPPGSPANPLPFTPDVFGNPVPPVAAVPPPPTPPAAPQVQAAATPSAFAPSAVQAAAQRARAGTSATLLGAAATAGQLAQMSAPTGQKKLTIGG